MATSKNDTKNDRVYVRINNQIKADFEIVARHRGLAPATLLHSLIVRTIHDQREKTPHIFAGKAAAADDHRPEKKEKVSVSARKSGKDKKLFSASGEEIPLIEEAESTGDGEGDQ